MPKVSVVIPAYNAMAYLPEALESVLSQTLEDYEVLIVNDGSNDSIEEWFNQVEDSRVRLISQTNRGLAGARNTGVKESKGEFIAFLDADDRWHKTKLAKQVSILESSLTVGLVYTWMALIDQNGTLTGRFVKNQTEGRVWEYLIIRNCVGSGSTPMVRKACFDVVGHFDENLGSYMEDRDMWLRIAPLYEFAVVKEVLVDYRQHPISASKNWDAMTRSAKIILEKAFVDSSNKLSASEKEILMRKAWGRINLALAWKPLQSRNKNYQKSKEFIEIALQSEPQLFFTEEYIRLKLTTLSMKIFGDKFYSQLLEFFNSFRRLLSFQKKHTL